MSKDNTDRGAGGRRLLHLSGAIWPAALFAESSASRRAAKEGGAGWPRSHDPQRLRATQQDSSLNRFGMRSVLFQAVSDHKHLNLALGRHLAANVREIRTPVATFMSATMPSRGSRS